MSPETVTLAFSLSGPEAQRQLVIELGRIFHVVPSAPASGDRTLLTVEVDAQYPELVPEVRDLVREIDAAASELASEDA
jgi:hypothetical protein